jgi:fibronectin-binding autotransporter adhesin
MNQLLRLLLLKLTIIFATGTAHVSAQMDFRWAGSGAASVSDNWGDKENWESKLRGSTDPFIAATTLPGPDDDVYFDALSFIPSPSIEFVEINIFTATCRNIILTGVPADLGYLPEIRGNGKLSIYGALTWGPTVVNQFTGTIEFRSPVPQTISTVNVTFNGPVIFNNPAGVWTLATPLSVNDITIQSGTLDVSASNHNIFVRGNWASTGVFVARNGTPGPNAATVHFIGNGNQTVSAAASNNEFFSVVVNKPNGEIIVNSDFSIGKVNGTTPNGSIQFTKGIVNIPSEDHALILNTHATVVGANSSKSPLTLVSGANADPASYSYVDGYVVKRMVASDKDKIFAFPVGDGGVYRPAGVLPENNPGATAYKARYVSATPPFYDNIDGVDISIYEYWNITELGGSANSKVILSWQIPVSGPAPVNNGGHNYLPGTDLPSAQRIVIAALNNGTWTARSGVNHHITNSDPDIYAGFVQTNNAMANRTQWTLGYTEFPLPVELLYFRATFKEGVVELNWATAQEINNGYFTIERSADGQTFTEVLWVEGAGNSAEVKQYQTADTQPYSGISYYRLKQTDQDGKFSYSKVVAVNGSQDADFLQAYQSSSGQLQVNYQLASAETGILYVHDSQGRQVWSKAASAESYQAQITLVPGRGLYLVTLQSSQGTLVKKVIVY